jgi:hypothetical protein
LASGANPIILLRVALFTIFHASKTGFHHPKMF